MFGRKTVPYRTVKGFDFALYGTGDGSAHTVDLPSICTADTVYGDGAHPYVLTEQIIYGALRTDESFGYDVGGIGHQTCGRWSHY